MRPRRLMLSAPRAIPALRVRTAPPSAEEVNRYLASQEGKQRPKSLTNHLSLLSKILTDAVEACRLTANRLLRSKAVQAAQSDP
jgi:hypothetical protein